MYIYLIYIDIFAILFWAVDCALVEFVANDIYNVVMKITKRLMDTYYSMH